MDNEHLMPWKKHCKNAATFKIFSLRKDYSRVEGVR